MSKYGFIIRLVTFIGCIVGLVAIVYAQVSGPSGAVTLIDPERILFSWGAVVIIGAIAASVLTSMLTCKHHTENEDIHATSGSLAIRFESREDCQVQHNEIKTDFNRVHGRLDEMNRTLGRIEGKLEKE